VLTLDFISLIKNANTNLLRASLLAAAHMSKQQLWWMCSTSKSTPHLSFQKQLLLNCCLKKWKQN